MDQLKLYFHHYYDGNWYVSDENYDYCPDTGASPTGCGNTKEQALLDYFSNAGFNDDVHYILEDK